MKNLQIGEHDGLFGLSFKLNPNLTPWWIDKSQLQEVE